MGSAGKISEFYREGNDWFCNASLPSDISVILDGTNFHLHKFPLISRCGRIANNIEESPNASDKTYTECFQEFPGGADAFFMIVKFCYGNRVELTPKNVVMLYCAADYLDMTDTYGEDNLLSRSEFFFHKHILRHWKNCIIAFQSCEPFIPRADKLQITSRCLNALSIMVCTDPGLFGWPMMMYGSLQSPGGSILWNGINTGAKIRSTESDWWFEDISYLCVELFERLIQTMKDKGIAPEVLASAVMYYCSKYLPGLGRWQGGKTGVARTISSFSMTQAAVDQRALLESAVKLLPDKKDESFCRFLLGLLRVALILGVDHTCLGSLEERIGIQLELANLDGLLITSYSDSDTLYNTDCVERIIRHFVSFEPGVTSKSPLSLDLETSPSPSSGRWKRVARLVDNYIAEVACDVNLKPRNIRLLAEALPECSRSLHDGLYRALDIFFKAHPWLSNDEREQLFGIVDLQKLSIDACAHASQNERLPLRVVLQILFVEQTQLRTALAGYLHVIDAEHALSTRVTAPNESSGQTVTRENQVLKVHMERLQSRIGELEEEFKKMKEEMKKVANSHLNSTRHRIGYRLIHGTSNLGTEMLKSDEAVTPGTQVQQARPSTRSSRHRKSFSLF